MSSSAAKFTGYLTVCTAFSQILTELIIIKSILNDDRYKTRTTYKAASSSSSSNSGSSSSGFDGGGTIVVVV